MSSISVILHKHGDPNRQVVSVDIVNEETIESLAKKVGEVAGIEADSLSAIFSGMRLSKEQKITDLIQGPGSYLTMSLKDPNVDDFEVVEMPSDEQKPLSSFYVNCRHCQTYKAASLKASCSKCKCNDVIFLNQPKRLNDVLTWGTVEALCMNCDTEGNSTVHFHCNTCSNEGSILQHLKANRENIECLICGENEPLVFALDCEHVSCVPCISAFMETNLKQWLFVYKSEIGFTMKCPMVDCNMVISDPHHFYLMGKDNYTTFQRLSSEKFMDMQSGAVYCPYPKCGAGFTVSEFYPFEDDTMVLCPECSRQFCHKCTNPGKCICDVETPSVQLVHQLSKPCPRCNIPVERSGGCSHMRCPNCNLEWCFLCATEWSARCQWDHWLD